MSQDSNSRERMDIKLLQEKTRALNTICNYYLILYFVLLLFHTINIRLNFLNDEFFMGKLLLLIWIIIKPIIFIYIIRINKLLGREGVFLGLIALILPFGELLAANLTIRKAIERIAD